MRRIILTFDRQNFGRWPFGAATEDGDFSAHGPSELFAIENLKRVINESDPKPSDYPKTIEVDW